jgi:hypothetical protein
VDEDTHEDAQVVGLVLVDRAVGHRVHDSAGHGRLGRSEHLDGLLRALDGHLVEEKRVGLAGQVRRDDRQQGGEPVLVVGERVREGRTRMTRLRANDQVDVGDLVAVADERLTKKEVRCHVDELLFGKLRDVEPTKSTSRSLGSSSAKSNLGPARSPFKGRTRSVNTNPTASSPASTLQRLVVDIDAVGSRR